MPVMPAFVFSLSFFQLLDHFLRHMDPRHIVVHEFRHTRRFGDDDPYLDRLAELFCLFHEADEFLRLKNGLGLEILGAGAHLSLHLGQLRVHRIAAGGNHRALGKLRRFSHQLVPAQIHAFLQPGHGMDQRYRIQVKDRLRLGMVAQLRVVTGQQKQVLDPEHGRAQQIGLQGDPVPVPAGQLVYGRQPLVHKRLADGQRTQAHDGRLIIRHIHRRHAAQIGFRILQQVFDMEALGGPTSADTTNSPCLNNSVIFITHCSSS